MKGILLALFVMLVVGGLLIGLPVTIVNESLRVKREVSERTIEPVRVSTDLSNPNIRCPPVVNGIEVHAEWQVGSGGIPSNLRCVVGF